MKQTDFYEQKLQRLQLIIYLLPVVGFFPALWTLYRPESSREHAQASRLSVTLTLGWLLTYASLWSGAILTSHLTTIRLLYLNGLLTSGYFVVCLGLMIRLFQGKLPYLPGISLIAQKIGR